MTSTNIHTHVFNVVWTGEVFQHLQLFVASLLRHSDARFRFVANACAPAQVKAMEAFSARHPGRVTEVVEVSTDVMLRHGQVLDEIFHARDDGELFCFVDADIAASGPFLPDFDRLLADADAVTSGKEVWSTDNVRPAANPGVSGEHFFDQDGFVFGSPHLALYRRSALAETLDRWEVGFGHTGNDLPTEARQRLEEVGRSFWIYDTGKVVNILFQADGHRLRHEEHPALTHIGGVSHFLAPPSTAPAAVGRPPRWGEGPDWGRHDGMAERYAVAELTAHALRELCAGRPAPPIPPDVPPPLSDKLALALRTSVDLVASYGHPASRATP